MKERSKTCVFLASLKWGWRGGSDFSFILSKTVGLALNGAVRAVEKRCLEKTELMKELEEAAKQFKEAHAISYRMFDSELIEHPYFHRQNFELAQKDDF